MQNTSNTFLKGLNSDMHPLTTSLLEYVDALNATLITYNGNELMLQNDMGNTRIQDDKTGNIMGLREGFIPLGIKEHGGIMYIASVNKEGLGELGTIPSPVIRYNLKKSFNTENYNYNEYYEATVNKSELFKLTDLKVNTGEKFVVVLGTPQSLNILITYRNSNNEQDSKSYNVFTTQGTDLKPKYGVYRIGLYSQTDDLIFDLNNYTENKYDYYTK